MIIWRKEEPKPDNVEEAIAEAVEAFDEELEVARPFLTKGFGLSK